MTGKFRSRHWLLTRFTLLRRLLLVGLVTADIGCGTKTTSEPPATAGQEQASVGQVVAPKVDDTPLPPMQPWQRSIQRLCGESSPQLARAAARLAKMASDGTAPQESISLSHWLHTHGVAVVRPQLWSISGRTLTGQEVLTRYQAWKNTAGGKVAGRWCGVGYNTGPEGQLTVGVVDGPMMGRLLSPIPSTARVSQWLTVKAVVPKANSVKVVVMGPRGRPRTLPTSFDRSTGRLLARFSADSPGQWLIQVLADRGRGPLPVIEAVTSVGKKVHDDSEVRLAPGEQLPVADGASPAQTMFAMVNESRKSHKLPALRWSEVDAKAAALHLGAMRRLDIVAHDAHDGTPRDRLAKLGSTAAAIGENIARAGSLHLAHRALWASPSHRANILDTNFSWIGIAIQRDKQGRVWVVQVFSSSIH